MTVQVRLGIIFVVLSLGTVLSALLAYNLSQSTQEISEITKKRLASFQLANELRQSSDNLTRMARTFVATQDKRYLDYFNEIIAIREGTAPYPPNYDRIYWDFVASGDLKHERSGTARSFTERMRDLGFSESEFEKLAEAKARSDALIRMEEVAINATLGKFRDSDGNFTVVAPPDPELARSLLFGTNYHAEKALIMRPIQAFFDLVDSRTARELETALQAEKRLTGYLLVIVLASLLFIVFSLAFTRRTIAAPLNALSEAISSYAESRADTPFEVTTKTTELRTIGAQFEKLRTSISQYVSELELSRNETRDILDATPDPIVISDANGVIKSVNRQAQAIFGYDAEELIGLPIEALIPARYRKNHPSFRTEFFKNRSVRDMGSGKELYGQHKDGTEFPVEISLSPVETRDGPAVASGIRDVTEQRKTNAELEAKETLLRVIFESLPQGMVAFDAKDELVAWNDRYREIFEFGPNDLQVGTPTWEVIHDYAKRGGYGPGDPTEITDKRFEVMKAGNYVRSELNIGEDQVFDAIIAPIEGGGGVISYTDITERKEAEHLILQKEAQLRMALENMPGAILVVDKDLKVVLLNERYREFYGDANGLAVPGTSMEDVLKAEIALGTVTGDGDPDSILDARLRSFHSEDYVSFEDQTPDGRFLQLTRVPAPDGHRVTVAVDITDLKTARAEALAAAQAKSNFLATMSHEIRTPMNGVMTMARLLDETTLSAEQQEMSRTIRQSADALTTIINDILDFSKIEAGKLAIDAVTFNVLDEIESVADLIAPRAEAASLLFLLQIDQPLPAALSGDHSRFRQILLNLAGNAVKFTENGSVTIRARRMPSDGQEYRLRVSVEDTGIGMTESQVANLFQAFAQAEASTARRFGGTGLGLAISKQLVELMGGRIGVESEPGRGSTFWFEIPFEVIGDDYIEPKHDLSGAHVVIAGYDAAEAATIEAFLKMGGVTHISKLTKEEDIQALKGGAPIDLIILDGRPGYPSVLEWGRLVPEGLDLDQPFALMTAPHMAMSALQLDQTTFPALTWLGAIPAPIHTRRLWEYVAVSLGLMSRSELQRVSTAAATFQAPSHEVARANNAMVLVAEDNPTNQLVIGRVLGRMGIAYRIANDGKAALDLLGQEPFDLLLSDFHMPVMDGFELTRRIRESESDGEHLPIVALTADVLPETARRCEEVGMDGYLRKPIELNRLEDILNTYVPNAFIIRTGVDPLQEYLSETTASAPTEQAASPRALIADVDPDIFDPDALNDAFGDFNEDAASFVLSYLDSLPEVLTAVDAAFVASDFAQARHHAHAAKGASLSTGAMRFGRLMSDVQDALDDDDPDTADIYREGLQETLEELQNSLAPLRSMQ